MGICRERSAFRHSIDIVIYQNHWIYLQNIAGTLIETPFRSRLLGMTSEILIHAADVEGLCQGIDEDLVQSRIGWKRFRLFLVLT